MRVVAGAVVVVHHPELFSEVGGEEEGVQLQCARCKVQCARETKLETSPEFKPKVK